MMTSEDTKQPRSPNRFGAFLALLGLVLGLVGALAWWFVPWRDEEPQIILLVTLDTLRADHLDFYGYPRATAPVLAKLAKTGVLFKRAMASSSHTAPSHATILTGQYPYQHGVLANGNSLSDETLTMATMLADRGYATGAIVATSFLAEISSSFQYVDAEQRNAEAVTDRAIAWLNVVSKDQDIFLWVHYYDIHQWADTSTTPLEYRERLRHSDSLDSEEIEQTITQLHALTTNEFNGPGLPFSREMLLASINDYDARIRYTDHQVGRLLNIVSARSKKRILIVTADHGEGLGSHGVTGHGVHLYEEQLHVPLIIDAPGLVERTTPVDALVHHIDLLPTVADIVGSELPASVKGRSLFPLLSTDVNPNWPDRLLFAQRRPFKKRWINRFNAVPEGQFVVRKGDMKLLVRTKQGTKLFDLAADPHEHQALDRDGRGTELTTIARELGETILTAEEQDVPEKLQNELRSLGYID